MKDKLYRAYVKESPVTKVWRRNYEEAIDDLKMFRPNQQGHVISKPYEEVMKNRKKTGFRGIL